MWKWITRPITAYIDHRIAVSLYGLEIRMRGTFASPRQVRNLIDEHMEREWQRLERLRDDCCSLLDLLARQSDAALLARISATREQLNAAIQRRAA